MGIRLKSVRLYQEAINYLIRKEGIEKKPIPQTSDGEKNSPIVEYYDAIYPPYEVYKGKKIDLKI